MFLYLTSFIQGGKLVVRACKKKAPLDTIGTKRGEKGETAARAANKNENALRRGREPSD